MQQKYQQVEKDQEKYFALLETLSFYNDEKIKLKQELNKYDKEIEILEKEEIRKQFENNMKQPSGNIQQLETTIRKQLNIPEKKKENPMPQNE